MHLKLFVLSVASVVLWLAPLVVLDKRLDIHKALQGVSLTAAIACAVTAGNIARELSEQGEIEEIKARAITADVVDEIATSAYIFQQQRQQEAEQILSGQPEREEAVEALKRAWLLDCNEPSEPVTEPLNQPNDNALTVDEERFTNLNLTKNQAIELIQKMRSELNQTQTIEKLWECKKGGSEAWKRAYAQFKSLMEEGG
jgi:polyhydroxyalkanoate synthesis regulator phasin